MGTKTLYRAASRGITWRKLRERLSVNVSASVSSNVSVRAKMRVMTSLLAVNTTLRNRGA